MTVDLPIPRTKVEIDEKAEKLLHEVIDSGQFIKGPQASSLGEEFAKFCQTKYGVGSSSGSTALFAALKVAGIKQGDEVITVPNTFIATVNAVILAGGRPVFSDIDPKTFNMSIDSLRKVITTRTKAIIPVHLYGLMAPMPEIMEIAEEKDLIVIEDACQAHGAEIEGKRAGSFGDFAAFSFYPTKLLATAGDGGIVVTNNEEYAESLGRFINHGRKSQYEYAEFGFNFRLSELQAAIVRIHLKRLDKEIERRREIAEYYNSALESIDNIEAPYSPEGYKHVYYLYTSKAKKRNDLIANLKSKEIGASIEYPIVLHQLDYVKSLNPILPNNGLKNSENCLDEICALPMFSSITEEQLKYVTDSIAAFYN
ncbi:MAG: DegT/DnrJ/EryC1/StrS family aminotransferase [Candidatus Thorarchaeota archaeon]